MTRPAENRFRFLVSVRTAEEAAIALGGGADIIDAKEPRRGALGAVDGPELRAIVEAVAGLLPVSATIGDCDLSEAADRVPAIAQTDVDYVKIGLFGAHSAASLKPLERFAAKGIQLIAVMFADRLPEWRLIPHLAETGFAGVMLDTADKTQGGLRAHLGMAELERFIGAAHANGMMAGLAGSLQAQDVEALVPLGPDIMGFRGALCVDSRRGEALQGSRITAVRSALARAFARAA